MVEIRGQLGSIPGLGFGHSNNHSLQVMIEQHLTAQSGVLVQNPRPGISFQHKLLVVRGRRQLLEPLLGDIDLAFGGAAFDIIQAMRFRVDEATVAKRSEQSLAGEAQDLALRSFVIDG